MASLGSRKHPAEARVRTAEKAEAIIQLCNQHGWVVFVGIEPKEIENVSDVMKLMRKAKAPIPEFLQPE
jgi:hypothetical protein